VNPVLVAGIGNIFLGDDGFGVEVLNRIDEQALPAGVSAVEYGIRGVHLAYDLLDGEVQTLIMVDALPMDEPPGTVSLLELDEAVRADLIADPEPVDSHSMNPQAVVSALHALGGYVDRILVVGCQPQSLAPGIGLSAVVRAAVEPARRLALETAAEHARQTAGSR
jgi:hydrogenase maturation protease